MSTAAFSIDLITPMAVGTPPNRHVAKLVEIIHNTIELTNLEIDLVKTSQSSFLIGDWKQMIT